MSFLLDNDNTGSADGCTFVGSVDGCTFLGSAVGCTFVDSADGCTFVDISVTKKYLQGTWEHEPCTPFQTL